jgi:hypothetical protein
VRNQHRFRALQVRIGRHGRASGLFGAIECNAQPLRQIGAHLVNRSTDVEAQIGGNLFVTAAAAVQLVSRVADQHDELLFDEMIHVLSFVVVEKSKRG